MTKNITSRSMILSTLIHVFIFSAFLYFRGHSSNSQPIIIDFSLEKTPLSSEIESKPFTPKKVIAKTTIQPKVVDSHETFPDTSKPDTSSLPTTTFHTLSTDVSQTNAAYDDSIARLKTQYIQAHYTEIRDKIYRLISYPALAQEKEWQGEVKVSFFVHCDGRVDDIKVMESSGYTLLDQNAMDAVKRAAPYAPSPKKVEIRLPIKYRLE